MVRKALKDFLKVRVIRVLSTKNSCLVIMWIGREKKGKKNKENKKNKKGILEKKKEKREWILTKQGVGKWKTKNATEE